MSVRNLFYHYFKKIKMNNIDHHRTMDAGTLFAKGFVESKSLYLYLFNAIPSIHYINVIDGERACAAFRKRFGHRIVS